MYVYYMFCSNKDNNNENGSSSDIVELSSADKQQLHPYLIRNLLHELWTKEKRALIGIISALDFGEVPIENPTDIFFKQNQIITPTRFRQVV